MNLFRDHKGKLGYKVQDSEQGKSIFNEKIEVSAKKRSNASMRSQWLVPKEKEVKLAEVSAPQKLVSKVVKKVWFKR